MGRIRITIAGLMGLIVLLAIGLASLREPTELWASGVFSLALGLNFAAIVSSVASAGRARSTSAGFAICGRGYLVLSLTPWFQPNIGEDLITTSLIRWGYRRSSDPPSFFRIAHSLFGIASGIAGAPLARVLSRGPGHSDRSTSNPSDQP